MEEEIVLMEENDIEEINIEEENYSGKPYVLPIASADTLGGIKVGKNLEIKEDGTLNAKASESGGIKEEQDPTVPAHVKAIKQEDIDKWNSGTGGSVDVDLTDYAKKSELPTKTSELENDSNFINELKTINGYSLKGTGNIVIQGGSGGSGIDFYGGSVFITSTNENPSQYLGGEWELIDKHYKEWSYYSSNEDEIAEYVEPHKNATPYAFGIIRSEHSVYIRYYFRTAAYLNDNKQTIGTLKYEKFGINGGLYFGIYDISAGSEEGIALMNISSSTGEMYCSDVIGVKGTQSIPVGTQIRFEVEARTPVNYMLDEHCDKFFWKRIG